MGLRQAGSSGVKCVVFVVRFVANSVKFVAFDRHVVVQQSVEFVVADDQPVDVVRQYAVVGFFGIVEKFVVNRKEFKQPVEFVAVVAVNVVEFFFDFAEQQQFDSRHVKFAVAISKQPVFAFVSVVCKQCIIGRVVSVQPVVGFVRKFVVEKFIVLDFSRQPDNRVTIARRKNDNAIRQPDRRRRFGIAYDRRRHHDDRRNGRQLGTGATCAAA